jgi:acyl-[acyl-carrier-protein]-phospholipid O-acyltransferase / long-chain-fatty-acid--[acyl-carrier-protein] ligase
MTVMNVLLTLIRTCVRILFRYRAFNTSVLREPGPVLLLPNHVSWFDWLFLGICLDADWRFVTSSTTAQTSPVHRWIMVNRRTFPVDPLSPYAARRMAEHLQKGGRLVLFPEGQLSRTGSLMKLFDGTGFLLHRTGAKVITAYVRGAHRLPSSPNAEQKQRFPRITVHFSEVLTPPHTEASRVAETRRRLTSWLRDRLIEQQFRVEMEFGPATVAEAIHASIARRPRHLALEDLRSKLTYRRMELAATLLSRQWRRLIPPDVDSTGTTRRVGVLLPNMNVMPLTLLSLWNLGRVPAILNYTAGATMMGTCAELAGIRHLVTSRAFCERAGLDLGPLRSAGIEIVYIEDVRDRIGGMARLAVALRLVRSPTPSSIRPEDTAVVLFTSGSEGVPKGVELSHANLLANLRQLLAATDMQDRDRFFTALPIFHSFGLTAGLLLPLVRGAYAFLYPSPLHYRIVPTVAYQRDCTILLATNTFLSGYARRADAYDFRAVRYLFAGAEKVQESTSALWAQRFGVRVLEGYGATECSPVISVNTPLVPKHGSAGRFLPGIEQRIEAVDGVPEGGRLFVRGPNVMRGYLNPEADAKFRALAGWYDTGDIARVDDDGFLFLLGRLKRFAKISGEMVSLTAVEDVLAGAFPEFGQRFQIAVISRPCEEKGEKLVAVTNEADLTIEMIRVAGRAKGLNNLSLPRELLYMRILPKLGSGKVNYRELAERIADCDSP